jgi:trimeric autotransporter adhesin
MKKCLLIILSCITLCQLQAADYYWVGGTGNWSDLNHWRLGSSAGSIPSIVPSAADNVFFDNNSGFTAASKIVTLNANGFCNNMTWGNVANSPTFITTSAAFKVQVSGNLSLSPTTTYQVIIVFTGATPATLTTNGTVTGQFGIEIDKPGSSLTVTDSLIVPSAVTTAGTNGLTFTAGTFDITGKKMKVYQFVSSNDNVRVLQMANADLNITSSPGTSTFVYTGLGKTLNAAGSTVYTGGFRADGGSYNKVTATNASGPTLIMISNTTFNSLTFSPAAGTIHSDIANGNTVDTLIFNGYGYIGSSNTIGSVLFGLVGSIDGTGNNIRKIVAQHNFQVSGNYTNTVDSLLLAANRTTTFRGTFNINKYLYVAGAPCEAYTEINGDSIAGTVNFAAGAIVNISNVILTGVKATGPVTPIPVNGIDGTGNAGFTITETSAAGTTLYWVGGAGDWNDRTHWSTASGGGGGACIPFTGDDVVFDANSGLVTGTITTSSSSFCKNMTWTGVGTVTFSESATSPFRIYGSLVLDNSVTMNSIFEFMGNANATITNNGSTLGGLQFIVSKAGAASVALVDNWSNVSGSIILNSGGFNMSGRTVSIYFFSSTSGLSRSLDISNATISMSNDWDYRGLNKSIVSTGSYITASIYFRVDGLSYPKVDLTYGGATGVYNIWGTTFDQLTFTSSSALSVANLGSGNTFRRLEFKGKGSVGAGNIIDSLILAGSRNYAFGGINTINKYLQAQATPCSGLTEIRGPGTLAFAGTAVVNMNNIYMQNMTATGQNPTFNGADAGGNVGWTITSASGGPRYWIGGAGDWNDAAHWSSTSGGAGGACIPTVYDDVYFNAGSGFTAASKTVTVNNGNAYCRNINWTGATNSPTWSKSASWNIECWGDSIIVNPATTLNVSFLTLKGSNATFLKGSAPSGDFDLYIDKPGGSITILNDYSNILSDIQLINGAFNAPGRTMTVKTIDNLGSANASSIDISNANLTVVTGWRYSGATAAHALNAAGSTITSSGVTTNGFTYNKINLYGTTAISGSMNSSTIDSLIFTDPSTTSLIGISGINNTLNYVEYKGSGGIYATGNTIDTLVFFPGSTYTLTAGTNTTITGEWFGSGTPCRPTEILSSSTSANATVTKTSGTAEFDYIRLRRITAAGAAQPFIAREHSNDLGNNVNWNIEPYNGAAPMEGLGSDTAITIDQFPYTLTTDGFFGSPSSQYLWNDNSTLDSLVITGYGTYTVDVSFADGCSVSDQVTISHLSSLPVTLVNFNAKVQDCQSLVSWEVTDAVNFSHFMIEQSKDGSQFASIGEVLYTPGVDKYSYIDKTPGHGKILYRLKCVDADGKYKFSPVASVSLNCNDKLIQVYPTVTSNTVNVMLPQGYENARLYLMNTSGQRIAPVVNGTGVLRTVSLLSLPSATYILQVTDGRETKSFKIVKQ